MRCPLVAAASCVAPPLDASEVARIKCHLNGWLLGLWVYVVDEMRGCGSQVEGIILSVKDLLPDAQEVGGRLTLDENTFTEERECRVRK